MSRVDVRLLRYDDVAARAYPAAAFSNGFEWERWSARWCETCNHDETLGAMGNTGVTACPIAEVLLVGSGTPAELEEVALGGLENRYACTGYEVREGEEDAREGLPAEGGEPIWSPPDMDH